VLIASEYVQKERLHVKADWQREYVKGSLIDEVALLNATTFEPTVMLCIVFGTLAWSSSTLDISFIGVVR
jgi:hypothetical protein